MKNRPDPPIPSPSERPALRAFPSKLFVETTSRCNLSCFMCVKQSGEGCLAEGDLSPERFAALEPAFPHLEALILNGVGEPLLHPGLEEFIRRARRSMPEGGWIGFQTNGLLLDQDRALSLVEAGVDRICLSIDAVSPEAFRRLREGGELSAVEKAFAALRTARERAGRPEMKIGAEFVLMRENLHELSGAVEWAAGRGADFMIVTHMLPYDERHAEQAAYVSCTDAAIELFRQWQDRAAAEGVDISRYFDILWKYDKTPEEKRVTDFVDAMKAEAGRRNIFLDLKKLFAIDFSRLEQLESIFALARQAAERSGIDLQLPQSVPREERQCHFVEDGGAFVSWEGEVHPCYFLWHRYNCFASGWTQFVRPKVFGSLADRDILQIWNGSEFRTFRENVIAYDYPYCISCRLAPCDYVQTEEFEQDCHIQGEPCGSCLWCMGLFQCLR